MRICKSIDKFGVRYLDLIKLIFNEKWRIAAINFFPRSIPTHYKYIICNHVRYS